MIQSTFERLYNNRITEKYVNLVIKDKKIIENGVEKIIKGGDNSNYKKLQDYVPIALLTWIPIVQSIFFARSKEIPEDKKYSLIFNEAYTAVLGVSVSLLAMKQIKKVTEKFVEQSKKVYKSMPPEKLKVMENGIRTAIPSLFAVMFCQYVAPILTLPLATKTSQYFMEKGKIKNSNEQKLLDKNA